MKEKNLEELIDGFLRKKLNDADQLRLQEIIASDPEAATLMKESGETYRFILHLRYKQIRNQLRSYDQQEAVRRKPNWIKRLFIAASFLLLTLLGSYLITTYSFSPRLVAKRNFETLPVAALSMEISPYVIAAEKSFAQDNFQNAVRLYQPVAEIVSGSHTQQVKWNLLMCNLAMAGPTQQWKKEMFIFISEADDHFKIKGYRILRLYNSLLYRLTDQISTRKFSPIKPRLI